MSFQWLLQQFPNKTNDRIKIHLTDRLESVTAKFMTFPQLQAFFCQEKQDSPLPLHHDDHG